MWVEVRTFLSAKDEEIPDLPGHGFGLQVSEKAFFPAERPAIQTLSAWRAADIIDSALPATRWNRLP